MNINEGNKLIAEFMGGRSNKTEPSYIAMYIRDDEVNFQEEDYPEAQHDGSCWKFSELKYESSWDWLMPVVVKCLDADLLGKQYMWAKSERFESYIGVNYFRKIKFIYPQVVKFIKWYNQKEQKK